MTCGSCELLLERELRNVRGVRSVHANYRTSTVTIGASADALPTAEDVADAVRRAGYRMTGDAPVAAHHESMRRKWMEIAGVVIVTIALYNILSALDIVDLAPSTAGALTLGGVFLIGLVAGSSSCLAVTGGLLLSIAAKYHDAHRSESAWEKFRPLLHFNLGRLGGYFLFGGIVGLLGRTLIISPRMTGLMNIVISMIMVYLGLSILHIIPKGSCPIRLPKGLTRSIAGLTGSRHPVATAGIGALTFFLPCGFTQSLQLVALASGSFQTGALTMFIFAAGTLPSLLGLSALSSTAHGVVSRLFLRFSGAFVLLLALFNLNSGFLLVGIDVPRTLAAVFGVSSVIPGAPSVQNGVQEIAMSITPKGYQPQNLTVRAGLPVRWTIDGTQSQGCTSVLVVPSLNITKMIARGINVIEFTAPAKPGPIAFSCSMGMVNGTINNIL